MTIDEAMRACNRLADDSNTSMFQRKALRMVLQNLGELQRHYQPERPCIINKRNSCHECETAIYKELHPYVCPMCGKRIDWSDPK